MICPSLGWERLESSGTGLEEGRIEIGAGWETMERRRRADRGGIARENEQLNAL
ncbi:hypothetical protein AArc1_0476 [Natrarchaeobaculum sulfurireducens]|uniref:Uncharacterized protein n=1 Tax=Natrarchaeobaculum sulfurireducens TaxID=2044521 RepID=A0A346PBC5_9EURY|nr:hypothetical protein AArc1_0476 [Natrarchaeobaculum sulfurireducens]